MSCGRREHSPDGTMNFFQDYPALEVLFPLKEICAIVTCVEWKCLASLPMFTG